MKLSECWCIPPPRVVPSQSALMSKSLGAFWNRWTLALDFGPGNAGLWTEISAENTHKICCYLCVFGPRFPEISVQSPAFPGPKSRPRSTDSKMPSLGVKLLGFLLVVLLQIQTAFRSEATPPSSTYQGEEQEGLQARSTHKDTVSTSINGGFTITETESQFHRNIGSCP